jgi:hypothetical protein
MQMPLFKPQTEWLPPEEFPDLKQYCEIAIDLETKDPNLNIRMGSGSVIGVGEVVGISVATEDFCAYYPIAHEGGGNLDRKMVLKWLQDVLNTPADKLFHNAIGESTLKLKCINFQQCMLDLTQNATPNSH